MGRLDNKVAVITGAAQGIGALMAKALADEGAKVLLTDVQDTDGAVKTITDAGGTAAGMKVDVTSNDDLAAMVQTATSEMGGLDIMVNNASIFATIKPKPFSRIDDDEFDLIMRVNARGVHQVMRGDRPDHDPGRRWQGHQHCLWHILLRAAWIVPLHSIQRCRHRSHALSCKGVGRQEHSDQCDCTRFDRK